VRASAPGKSEVTIKVTLPRERGQLVVRVPPLEDVRETKKLGKAMGAAGLLLTVGGGIVGTSIAVRCGGFFRDTCDAANGLSDGDRASALRSLQTQAWISNAAVGLGLVAVGLGAYFILSSPKVESPARLAFGLGR
jgi:hypothetical protein